MKKWLISGGVLFILISFYLMLLSLMNLFPFLIAFPLLYIAIVYTVYVLSDQRRFKGFRS